MLSPAASQTPKHSRDLVDFNSVAVLAPFELPLLFPAEHEKDIEFSNAFKFSSAGVACGADRQEC